MMIPLPAPLASTSWLAEHLAAVKIIDASWRMPGGGEARTYYDERHIPGAAFFDIDVIADHAAALPHMLPHADEFAAAIAAIGISEKDAVVIYDDQGIFSAPRVWWSFRAMGHERVAVLDGGLKKWLAENRPVTDTRPVIQPASYLAAPRPALVSDASVVRDIISRGGAQIIDARSPERFKGTAPEPRAGLCSGAMPGAKNTPFNVLINEDGTLKAPDALREIFIKAGVDLNAPAVTSCGSGVTAAVIALALESLGHHRWSLYDGSWAEWGKEEYDRAEYPVIVERG